MSDSMQDDIAYMKSLAEDGGRGPLVNGLSLFWAGLVFGGASVVQYASVKGYLPSGFWASTIIWGGAIVAFSVLAIVSSIGRKGVSNNAANRATISAWTGVGLASCFFVGSMVVVSRQVADFNTISFLFAPIILIIYGMGWWVSARMSDRGWLNFIAFGCFLSAPVLCAMIGRTEQLLAYAACLILLVTVPGFILMREKA